MLSSQLADAEKKVWQVIYHNVLKSAWRGPGALCTHLSLSPPPPLQYVPPPPLLLRRRLLLLLLLLLLTTITIYFHYYYYYYYDDDDHIAPSVTTMSRVCVCVCWVVRRESPPKTRDGRARRCVRERLVNSFLMTCQTGCFYNRTASERRRRRRRRRLGI